MGWKRVASRASTPVYDLVINAFYCSIELSSRGARLAKKERQLGVVRVFHETSLLNATVHEGSALFET